MRKTPKYSAAYFPQRKVVCISGQYNGFHFDLAKFSTTCRGITLPVDAATRLACTSGLADAAFIPSMRFCRITGSTQEAFIAADLS